MQTPFSTIRLSAKINKAIQVAAFKGMDIWNFKMTVDDDGDVEVFGDGDLGLETFQITDECLGIDDLIVLVDFLT